jgi:hypothetical protein
MDLKNPQNAVSVHCGNYAIYPRPIDKQETDLELIMIIIMLRFSRKNGSNDNRYFAKNYK